MRLHLSQSHPGSDDSALNAFAVSDINKKRILASTGYFLRISATKIRIKWYFLGDEKIWPSDSSGQTQNVQYSLKMIRKMNDGKPLKWVGHWHVSLSIYLSTLFTHLDPSSDIKHVLHGIPYTFSIIANIVQILLIFMIIA